LIRVDDVSVYQNLIHRIFDIGTVTIISTDSTDSRLEIYGVEKPVELKEMIRENVQKRRGRSLYMETL
jgi:membrane protein YdbS with pleckstrin-like domain